MHERFTYLRTGELVVALADVGEEFILLALLVTQKREQRVLVCAGFGSGRHGDFDVGLDVFKVFNSFFKIGVRHCVGALLFGLQLLQSLSQLKCEVGKWIETKCGSNTYLSRNLLLNLCLLAYKRFLVELDCGGNRVFLGGAALLGVEQNVGLGVQLGDLRGDNIQLVLEGFNFGLECTIAIFAVLRQL